MTTSGRLALLVSIAAAFALLVPLQHQIDAGMAAQQVEEEALYLSHGDQVKRLALGYDALLADVYWIRAIQYFGENAIANRGLSGAQRTPPRLLYPLLDVTTTLDPQYIEPYRFGGFFLADFVDEQLAFGLLQKGIQANPDNLNLWLDLAFLYWRSGDCESASVAYERAGKVKGAMPWVGQMAPVVLAECGKREFALRMLSTMYQSTDDPRVREDIATSIKGYQALDEIDILKQALATYSVRNGSPPQSLALLVRTVRPVESATGARIRINANGQPVDPNGQPYIYEPSTGEITTNPDSIVLPKIVMRRYEKPSRSN